VSYPTGEMLQNLIDKGWTQVDKNIWRTPEDEAGKTYLYSSRGAVAKQRIIDERK
jgi:hypothetical protein